MSRGYGVGRATDDQCKVSSEKSAEAHPVHVTSPKCADVNRNFAEFLRRKEQILASLDKSPKGSLDAPILDFLSWLNAQGSVVTTSSCSGRIAIFLGSSDCDNSKGGEWLLSSHEQLPEDTDAWEKILSTLRGRAEDDLRDTLVTFLMEPFLLHAECADADTAQRILEVARDVGLRESGLSLGRRRVMVQVRTNALRLEVPLALDGKPIVDASYFPALVRIANVRMASNAQRIEQFWAKLRVALSPSLDTQAAHSQWVLACPASKARSVKLAIEQRGFMDETRKMVSLPQHIEHDQRPGLIGIPIVDSAATWFEDLPADEHVASTDQDQVSAVIAPPTDESSSKKLTKKYRPAVTPADLEVIWRHGDLQLFRGEALPSKERPIQRGAPTSAALAERDAISHVVATMFSSNSVANSKASVGSGELAELLADVRALAQLQWRGDVALLPRGALQGGSWDRLQHRALQNGGLWEQIRKAVGARLLARQLEILVESEVRAGAVEVLAGVGDGWVTVSGPRGVRYTYDITKCMFSEGNAAEKARVAEWDVNSETILDLYAGIGFWTLPLLAAGASTVISCEWNPHAVEALRRGLELLGSDYASRCEILEGDNRRPEVQAAVAGRCDRVLLGLIPDCRAGFDSAIAALRDTGGLLHVHWNLHDEEETSMVEAVVAELEHLCRLKRGDSWRCHLGGVQRIKWYAPRVRHVRIDVEVVTGGSAKRQSYKDKRAQRKLVASVRLCQLRAPQESPDCVDPPELAPGLTTSNKSSS